MDQAVDIGDNATFTCEVFGNFTPINSRWLFNGSEVVADLGRISLTSDFNTTTLVIANVTVNDGGTYTCEVTDNVNNTITSNEATLFSKCVQSIMCVKLYTLAVHCNISNES